MRNNLCDVIPLALTANVEALVNFAGEQFYLESSAAPIDIVFLDNFGATLGQAKSVKTGISLNFAGKGHIASIRITSSITQAIRIAIADGTVNFNTINGTINTIAQQATVISNSVAVIGTAVAGALYGADSARKGVVFGIDKDTIAGRIAIGGAGVTFANASIILSEEIPVYVDTHAAVAARYAIAEVAGQSLRWEIAT